MMYNKTKLCLCPILLFCIPMILLAQFSGGTGSESDPYLVTNIEDLNNVRYYANTGVFFLQISDIDFSVPSEIATNWMPIVSTLASRNYINYDGGNNKIKNIQKPLFGNIVSSTLSNIVLESVNIDGYGAPLTEEATSSVIMNCHSSGIVHGRGGLISELVDGSIVNSSSSATVIGESWPQHVGGLVGVSLGNIKRSYSDGFVIASNSRGIGGLVGQNWGIISDCYSTATLSGSALYVGGLVGDSYAPYNSSAKYQNSYAACEMNISSLHSYYDIYIGGLIGGMVAKDKAFNCYWDTSVNNIEYDAVGFPRNTNQMTFPYDDMTFINFDFNNIWMEDTESVNGGYPLLNQEYIDPETDYSIYGIVGESNPIIGQNYTYKVFLSKVTPECVINLKVKNGPTIGSITTNQSVEYSFNYTPTSIVDLFLEAEIVVIDENEYNNNYLFPISVKNFPFTQGEGTEQNPWQVHNAEQLAAIGKIDTENIHFIQMADIDLGISPWNINEGWDPMIFRGTYDGNKKNINNLYIRRVETRYQALFSKNYGTIKNLNLNSVDVVVRSWDPDMGTGGFTSGLVATNNGEIRNCYVEGTIIGTDVVGLVIGRNDGIVDSSIGIGDVDLWGSMVNDFGGFVGQNGGSIDKCYSISNVTGIGGGFVSQNSGQITNCFHRGSFNQAMGGPNGGFVQDTNRGSIFNCFAANTLTGDIEGFLGYTYNLEPSPQVFHSYWDTQLSGTESSVAGSGRTTDEMTFPYASNTYEGWDFENIWIADNGNLLNNGYPFLRCFIEDGSYIEANTPTIIGDVTIISDTSLLHLSDINSNTPVVLALPNFANLSNIQVLGLRGSGTGNLTVAAGSGLWFGLIYYNNQWHQSIPACIEGPGILAFTDIDFDAKGDVIIVLSEGEDPTLPVELSAFDAVVTAQNFVRLNWVSESETELLGYRIYRYISEDLNEAILVSPLIPGTNGSTQHSYEFVDNEIYESGTYYYWLESSDLDGSCSTFGPVSVVVEFQSEESGVPEIELVTYLHSVFPNPFNPNTVISYSLAETIPVSINIYNSRGQFVKSISNCPGDIGLHKVYWDGRDRAGNYCSSGVYFIRMLAGRHSFQRKAILMK